MPYGDDKHRRIYEALVSILSEDNVEDDPAVVEAFYRDYYSYMSMLPPRVEFWVLPGSVGDVQAIYRLANRLDFPTSVSSTGLLLATCSALPGYPYWCFIDPKRMNQFWVDPENMYAVTEPYVSIAQLQSETMKYGLFAGVTGAGSQGSALATHLGANTQWTGWRTGRGRSLLGFEWVLPTGEIVRTGSLATGKEEYFWGEGPGFDYHGLWRAGALGPMGAFGTVTKAAVKLFPWPGPKVIPTEGVQPEKKSVLPQDVFKAFVYDFPSLEACVEAIRELAIAEVGAVASQSNVMDLLMLTTRSREEFWQKWHQPYWQQVIHNSGHMVMLILWAYAGRGQMEYEEEVISQIAREFNGKPINKTELEWLHDSLTASAVRDSHRGRYMRLGPLSGTGGGCDSLYDGVRSIKEGWRIKKQLTPPMGDGGLYDMGNENHKMWLADFGRIATSAVGAFGDKAADFEVWFAKTVIPYVVKYNNENRIFSTNDPFDASLTGHKYGNIQNYIASIKRELDPKNIASPGRLVNMRNIEKQQAQVSNAVSTGMTAGSGH